MSDSIYPSGSERPHSLGCSMALEFGGEVWTKKENRKMDVETGGVPFSPTPIGTLLLVTQGQLYGVLVSTPLPDLRPLQDCHNGAPSSSEIWLLCCCSVAHCLLHPLSLK